MWKTSGKPRLEHDRHFRWVLKKSLLVYQRIPIDTIQWKLRVLILEYVWFLLTLGSLNGKMMGKISNIPSMSGPESCFFLDRNSSSNVRIPWGFPQGFHDGIAMNSRPWMDERIDRINLKPWKRLITLVIWSANHRKSIGKPEENGGLMGFNGIYPLVSSNMAMDILHEWKFY